MASEAVSFDQELDAYLGRIRRETHCPRERKEQLLDQLEIDIQEYLSCHDVQDFAQVVAHFGEPSDIADSFVQLGDVTSVRKELKANKRWVHAALICVIAAVAAILLFVGGYLIRESLQNDAYRNGEFVVTVREGTSQFDPHGSSEVEIH